MGARMVAGIPCVAAIVRVLLFNMGTHWQLPHLRTEVVCASSASEKQPRAQDSRTWLCLAIMHSRGALPLVPVHPLRDTGAIETMSDSIAG